MTVMMARFLAAAILSVFAFFTSLAAAADALSTEHARSRLVPARDGFAPGEVTWFAFAQTLEEGWHVYWKNPGDSGLPLELEWSLPVGFSAGEIIYPVPERIPVGPFVNFGHHGEPVFLIPVTAGENARPGDNVEIGVIARWLICEQICVPEEGALSLALPVVGSPPANAEGAGLVARGRAGAPSPFEGEARFHARADGLTLETSSSAKRVKDAFFFPDAEGLIEPNAPQPFAAKAGLVTLSMKRGIGYDPAALASLDGVLVVRDGDGASLGVAVSAARSETPIAAPNAIKGAGAGAGGSANLAILLMTAFLGGIILNVMPCVFPIIFIKAASLVNNARANPGVARRHGVLYAAGVVATFAALGGLLLALRAGGEQLGWGFHLQSPVVVMVSAYVLFLVGLNLAGVYHVGESLQGIGGELAEKRGAMGAFFTGVLAVFVAAPCIGPLLSAPMGAAVFLPPSLGMLIFVVLGLGLAAPYVAVSFVPALGKMLPRPGPWMIVFKQALAFPVFAAAAYFLWVLAEQTGGGGLARALIGALLLAIAAWLFERSKGGAGAKRKTRGLVVRGAAAVAALAAIAPLFNLRLVETATASVGNYGGVEAIAFDPARIEALRAEGRPIFIDFTAAWCVVCQFNKATVLGKSSITAAFAANDVAFMVADWTRRDPQIAKALEAFGANGVPLYVYYPRQGEPMVLPLPLSERAILDAVGG